MSNSSANAAPSRRELRQFGLIFCVAGAVIGLLPLLKGRPPLWPFLAGGGVFLLLGYVVPQVLSPIYRAWMALGHALGWFNTRLILALVLWLVMTPIGLILRALGKDPLRKRPTPETGSYWQDKAPLDAPASMPQQF